MEKVEKKIIKLKVSDIIFKEDIYARFEANQNLITEYVENIDGILESENKISVSIDNILIDGYHRWKAIETAYGKDYEFEVEQHQTDNTDYIEIMSYAGNTRHGKRNSRKENIRNIRRLYMKAHSVEDIISVLGVTKNIVYEATTEIRKQEKEERNKKILDLYLRAENTEEKVAEMVGVARSKIKNIVLFSQSGKRDNFSEPFLYNIWNTKNGDSSHFGHFPNIFMKNLLHYHTDRFDIVFDPFGGGGTTVDVCKDMLRRYYVSDRIVIPGREKDIHQHDITNGLPKIPLPNLVFLDPPYWKQAKGKYSTDKNDLGNMELSEFNKTMSNLIKALKMRKVKKIAIVIQPTQYSNNFNFVDHIFDFHSLMDGYKIEARYILPYSTQQYTPQIVNSAKENNKCLTLNRDLVVWSL